MKIGKFLQAVESILEAENPFAKKKEEDDEEEKKPNPFAKPEEQKPEEDSGEEAKPNPFEKKEDSEEENSEESPAGEKPGVENGGKKPNPFEKKPEGGVQPASAPVEPGQEQQQPEKPESGLGIDLESLAVALFKIKGEIERLETTTGIASSPMAQARMELIRQRADIEAKLNQLDQGIMPQEQQVQSGDEQEVVPGQESELPQDQSEPTDFSSEEQPKDGEPQVAQVGVAQQSEPVINGSEPAGNVPDEVKQRFAAIKGPKKFDLNSNTVYYRDDTGKIFKAPADDSESAEEINDPELISKLKF